MIPPADYHVHTVLSPCADRAMTPEIILEEAERKGLRSIGLTDHFYDGTDPGIFSRLRAWLAGVATPVNVLVGCEADVAGPDRTVLPAAVAEELDFVMLSASHLHPHEQAVERPADETDPAAVARHLTALFAQAIRFPRVDVIAHPFCLYEGAVPIPRVHVYKEILALARRDGPLAELFLRARGRNIALGVGGYLRGSAEDAFLCPLLLVAKKLGLKFAPGSDAHIPAGIGEGIAEAARALELSEKDFWRPSSDRRVRT